MLPRLIFPLMINCFSMCESLNILAVMPHFGKSHFLVFSPLFEILATKGHNMTVISFFPRDEPLNNYKDVPLINTHSSGGDVITIEDTDSKMSQMGGAHLLYRFGKVGCPEMLSSPSLHDFMSRNETFDVILMEYFHTNCQMGIVKHIEAPIIGLSTCVNPPWINDVFGQPDNPAYIPSLFLDHSDKMSFLERVENTIMYPFFRAVYKFAIRERGNEYSKRYLGEDVLRDGDRMLNASLLLINTHFTLNRPKPLVPNVVEVGGIHIQKAKKMPKRFQRFLDESPQGVIYVSMGTMLKSTTFPKKKLNYFMKALSKFPQKIIWKWSDDTMEGKPDNVMLTKWAPQREILCHPNLKAYISHGGLLGTLEAVHCGVPVMIMPQFGDQHLNARAVEASGGGFRFKLSEATEKTVPKALSKILSDEFQRSAKELSARFRDRPLSAVDTAIYWIEYVARHKGAIFLRTAGADMPLYQYFLLDVIAFIGTVVVVISYLTWLLVKIFIKKMSWSMGKLKRS